MTYDTATLLDVHYLLVDAHQLLSGAVGVRFLTPARRRGLREAQELANQVAAIFGSTPVQVPVGGFLRAPAPQALAAAIEWVHAQGAHVESLLDAAGVKRDAPDSTWFAKGDPDFRRQSKDGSRRPEATATVTLAG
jgi:hypothetical protein